MSSRNVVDLRKKDSSAPSNRAPQKLTPSRPQQRESPRPQVVQRGNSPLRKKRRKLRLFVALFLLLVLGGVVYAISYVSYLPKYNVQTVTIVGTEMVSPDLVSSYVESLLHDGTHPYLSPDNIFWYHRAGIEREIVGYFPRIKSATISHDSLFSTAITVTVVERQQFALWCADVGDCYSMDDGGMVFAQAPEITATSTGQYIFAGGISTSTSPIGHTFVSAHIGGIVALLQGLTQSGFTPEGASVLNTQDFSVPLAEGFSIKASFGEDTNTLVRNLQLVLSSSALSGKESDLEYVDLRFGNRVYFKLKSQDKQQIVGQ